MGNQYVSPAGEFKWKPALAPKDVTSQYAYLINVSGAGTTETVILNSLPTRRWKLVFEQSDYYYQEMKSFLRDNFFGAKSFTWYNHADSELVTVRQEGSLKSVETSEPTSDQTPIVWRTELVLVEHFGS